MNPFRRKAKSQRTPLGHRTQCKCARCAMAAGSTPEQAMAKMKKWENEMLAKHGWFAHFVADDDASPTGCNVHTQSGAAARSSRFPDRHSAAGEDRARVAGHSCRTGQEGRAVPARAESRRCHRERRRPGQAGRSDRVRTAGAAHDPAGRHGKLDLDEIDAKFALQYKDLL